MSRSTSYSIDMTVSIFLSPDLCSAGSRASGTFIDGGINEIRVAIPAGSIMRYQTICRGASRDAGRQARPAKRGPPDSGTEKRCHRWDGQRAHYERIDQQSGANGEADLGDRVNGAGQHGQHGDRKNNAGDGNDSTGRS